MLNPRRDAEYLWLGDETAGAVHVEECRSTGISDRRSYQLVQTGRWQSPFPRVYVVFSGPIPLLTVQFAALLYAGDGATLSHESAGATYRLCRQPGVTHITVRYERQVDEQPGLVLHRSRTLTAHDVHPAFTPRRTQIERTVLDLLMSTESANAALGLVADAVRDRGTTPDRLRAALSARPHTRWRKIILEALPDLSAGAHSLLELRDAKLRRRHGLPMGTRQVGRLADGTEYLDVIVDEWRLHVELDGRLGHNRAIESWRDMKRDNRSEVARLRHLRYGWADMIERPCHVAIEQAMILRQQGWQAPFKRCPTCPPQLSAGL